MKTHELSYKYTNSQFVAKAASAGQGVPEGKIRAALVPKAVVNSRANPMRTTDRELSHSGVSWLQ